MIHDQLAEDQHYEKLDADNERREDERIETLINNNDMSIETKINFETVDLSCHEILLQLGIIKTTDGITYDTYAPTVHINNLVKAMRLYAEQLQSEQKQLFEGSRPLTDFESDVLAETFRKQAKTHKAEQKPSVVSDEEIKNLAEKSGYKGWQIQRVWIDGFKSAIQTNVGFGEDDMFKAFTAQIWQEYKTFERWLTTYKQQKQIK